MRREMVKKKCLMIIFLLIIFEALLFSGKIPKRAIRDMNVLLVTIDTIRVDYLGCYGQKGVETPHIDRLAQKGILFKSAFAQNVVTLPSHINILTGLYPLSHGVHDNVGFRLDPEFILLPEILKRKGYRTAAFIGSFILDTRFGLNQGFDLYDDYYGDTSALNDFAIVERRAEKVVERALNWLQANAKNRWFCWIHLFDPHMPYEPPEDYKKKYPHDFYAGEVAYTDSSLDPLLKFLESSCLDKSTFIILTGDHGESLGEHREKTHGIFAYNAVLHIPLIFYQPSLFPEPRIIEKKVRHIDILPTVLDVLKIKCPKEVQGRSLIPLIENPLKWEEDDCYFEALSANLNRNWAPLRGLISDDFKYIDLPIRELYDLESDYREERNLAPERISMVKGLADKLKIIMKNYSQPEAKRSKRIREDRETLEKLKALGYVGGTTSKPMKRTFGREDDPKNLIELDEVTQEAVADYIQGNPTQAIKKLNSIIEQRPTLSLTYSQLSFIYHEMGELEKAIETLEKALSLGLENESILSKLGVYFQEMGRFKRSVEVLELTVERFPYHIEAYNYLGVSLWRLGHFDKALETFEKLLAYDESYASAYNNLGSVYLSKKQYDLAKKHFEKAIEYDPRLPGPHNGLGVIYANEGKNEQAIENWKKAVELGSRQFDALYNLGILLAKRGRYEEALPYLEKFVNSAPLYKYKADIEKVKKVIEIIKRGRE